MLKNKREKKGECFMIKYQIWNMGDGSHDENFDGTAVPAYEVKKVVELYNAYVFEVEGITPDEAIGKIDERSFEKCYDDLQQEGWYDDEDIAKLLEEMIGKKVHVHEPYNIEGDIVYISADIVDKVIVLDEYGRVFALDSSDVVYAYTYLDYNTNHKTISIDPAFVTEIVVEEDSYSLDEWDGNNHTTGGTGIHQEVYKVVEIDGEEQDEYEPSFFIREWSQWQGSLPKGKLVNIEGLKEHLKKIDRDVEEYIGYINEITK